MFERPGEMTKVGQISNFSTFKFPLEKFWSASAHSPLRFYLPLCPVSMDAQDFTMPSPKRQRTESPKPAPETNPALATSEQQAQPKTAISQEPETIPQEHAPEFVSNLSGLALTTALPEPESIQAQPEPVQAQPPAVESNSFLDALMQHVESMQPEAEEAAPIVAVEATDPISRKQENAQHIGGDTVEASNTQAELESTSAVPDPGVTEDRQPEEKPTDYVPVHSVSEDPLKAIAQTSDAADVGLDAQDETIAEVHQESEGTNAPNGTPMALDETMAEEPRKADSTNATSDMPTAQTETYTLPQQDALRTNAPLEGAEFEIDSSPYISSDSDDSSDTTSDDSDDEDADGDYAMLDPEEQARILMAGDGGSDDEGEKKGKTDGGHLRTANEKVEEVIPKPDIVVTEEMKIEELGTVEGVVEKTVLVKATVSGEYQVLESNSLLCLADRSVVGVVAEPLGRVEQPMYTIRFTNDDAIKEAGLFERGTKVFYVLQHSTFVFTQPLKAVKGSDASNFHDEEVGDDEMEFSDDEAEAEHKKQLKMKRQGRRDEGGGRGRGRGGRGNYQRGGRQDYRAPSSDSGSVYGGGPTEISYDDVPDGVDEGYTPLARPANLNEMMEGVQREPLEGSHYSGGYSDRGDLSMGRGRGRGRGRGDRNRRGRGGRGSGGNQPSWTSHQSAQSNGYQQYSPQSQSMPPPPNFPYQYQHQQPHQPRLSPQHQQASFSPSPISPLPSSNQFNFNFQQQNQQWPGAQPYQQQQQYGQTNQAEQQWKPLHDPPQYGQTQPQGQFNWDPNLSAAAQVAAQLEQLKRSRGQ
jgi:H/ACA ribonucleoprotein complex non-core subunit NAF1